MKCKKQKFVRFQTKKAIFIYVYDRKNCEFCFELQIIETINLTLVKIVHLIHKCFLFAYHYNGTLFIFYFPDKLKKIGKNFEGKILLLDYTLLYSTQ